MRDTPGRCRSMPPLKFAFPLIRANTLITSSGASVVQRAAPALHRSPPSEAASQQDSDSKQGKPDCSQAAEVWIAVPRGTRVQRLMQPYLETVCPVKPPALRTGPRAQRGTMRAP